MRIRFPPIFSPLAGLTLTADDTQARVCVYGAGMGGWRGGVVPAGQWCGVKTRHASLWNAEHVAHTPTAPSVRPRLMGWNRGSRMGSHAAPVSDCRHFDFTIDMVRITATALSVVCDPAGQWSMHLKRLLTWEGEVR